VYFTFFDFLKQYITIFNDFIMPMKLRYECRFADVVSTGSTARENLLGLRRHSCRTERCV